MGETLSIIMLGLVEVWIEIPYSTFPQISGFWLRLTP
jgi:hypothetical protein